MNFSIDLQHVSLRRRMQEEFSYDLKRTLFSLVERTYRRPTRREVIRDVSFTIEAGEKFGIIGPNGSGKSTLLKLISSILKPTQGRVRTQGTIAPLIELGAGFDAELSVEDNIVYYGTLLGYSRKRMLQAVDRILTFAELLEYRRVPLKALSSGMGARLGFAVATDVNPDILLLDEVFAVGDEAFRRKSAARMRELWEGHHTIVLVSHDLASVATQCERAMWLDNGTVRAIGPANHVVSSYAQDVALNARRSAAERISEVRGIGNIDELRVDQQNATLAIRGWAVSPNASRTGTALGIFVDGRFVQEAAYGDLRPDVSEGLRHEGMLRSGFHGSCSLAGYPPGHHNVTIAVFDHVSEAFHPVGEPAEIELHAQRSSETSPPDIVTLGTV